MGIRKISCGRSHSVDDAEFGHQFHVVVLQRTAKKCTKIYNACAQLLFCSLNLLFGDAFVSVVVMVCLSSLVAVVESWPLRPVHTRELAPETRSRNTLPGKNPNQYTRGSLLLKHATETRSRVSTPTSTHEGACS